MTIISIIVKVVLWLFVFLIAADIILYLLVLHKERKKVIEDPDQTLSSSSSCQVPEGESVISSGVDDFQPGRVRSD